MIVLADMTARRERQFGDAELVLSIDLVEKPPSGASNLILATKPSVSTFAGLPGTGLRCGLLAKGHGPDAPASP